MISDSVQSNPHNTPKHDLPIEYMRRTRNWYLALGYDNPYVWAHYPEVPFQVLHRPLSQSRLTLITTAAPYQPDKGAQGPGAPYNAAAKFYQVYSGEMSMRHDLRISHVGIDRQHSSMKDSRCWFPIDTLREAVADGRIGSLARRFHGAPTNRSQRHTIEKDCPEILARCQQDKVNVALLLPNCPVCHQTLSLVARHLENNGIATVIMGCARDIVEYCGVPRFLFSDFPLGNPAGRPDDTDSQEQTLEYGLRLLETASSPRTTLQSPLRWSEDSRWKLDYCNIERYSPQEIETLRNEAEQSRILAREIREKSQTSE